MPLFKIDDMTCANCIATIDRTVKTLDADARIDADLIGKTVEVTSSADPVAIQAALIEAGYDAQAMAA